MTDKEKIEKLLELMSFIGVKLARVHSRLPEGSCDAKTLESIYAKIEHLLKEIDG